VKIAREKMKLAIFLAFCLIAELAFGAESDVLQLTDSDFDTVLKDTPVALVAFTGELSLKIAKFRVINRFFMF
jgi:hypothetical protein